MRTSFLAGDHDPGHPQRGAYLAGAESTRLRRFGQREDLCHPLARAFAAEVTEVCSTANLELVKSLGADRVIDHSLEDVSQGGDTDVVIFYPVDRFQGDDRTAQKEKGIYLSVDASSEKVKAGDTPCLLRGLEELVDAGKLETAFHRCYPWEEIVEAHRCVDRGPKSGRRRHYCGTN
jgi:hypothetical protein